MHISKRLVFNYCTERKDKISNVKQNGRDRQQMLEDIVHKDTHMHVCMLAHTNTHMHTLSQGDPV